MKKPGSTVDGKTRCYLCGALRAPEEFTETREKRHYRMCRECVSSVLRKRGSGKTRLPHTLTDRTCYLCRRVLPNASFTRRSNGTYFSACKECNRHVFAQRRRARLAASGGEYSIAEWEALLFRYDACPRCHRKWEDIEPPPRRSSPITADHIIPIALGGGSSIGNIQPLCHS